MRFIVHRVAPFLWAGHGGVESTKGSVSTEVRILASHEKELGVLKYTGECV